MILERGSFVIRKEKDIHEFLKIFHNQQDLPKSTLVERSPVAKGASFDHLLTDTISLGFVSNGHGYNLTESGLKILVSNPDGQLYRQLWKEAYSKVSLYKEFLLATDSKDPQDMIMFIYQHFEIPRKLRKHLGMGIRRFFEGYYPEIELPPKLKQPKIKSKRFLLRRGRKIAPISNISQNVALKPPIIADGHELTIDQYIEIQKTLKEIKDKVGGTENIKKILEIL